MSKRRICGKSRGKRGIHMNKDMHFIRLMRAGGKLEFTHRTAEFIKETEKTIKGIESFEGIELKRERIVYKDKLDKVIDRSKRNNIDIFELEAVTLDESKVSVLKEEMIRIVSDKIEALRVDAVKLEQELAKYRAQDDCSLTFEIRCKKCGSSNDIVPYWSEGYLGDVQCGLDCRECKNSDELLPI